MSLAAEDEDDFLTGDADEFDFEELVALSHAVLDQRERLIMQLAAMTGYDPCMFYEREQDDTLH